MLTLRPLPLTTGIRNIISIRNNRQTHLPMEADSKYSTMPNAARPNNRWRGAPEEGREMRPRPAAGDALPAAQNSLTS